MRMPIRPLLNHPKVVRSIRSTLLKRGTPRHELRDAVAEVQRRALEAALRGKAPTELPRMRALCNRIARDYAIDETRKQQVREKYDVGLCEDPDAHVNDQDGMDRRDPVDRRRLLGILHEQVLGGEMPEHAMAILEAEAEGVPHRVSARDLGLTERAVEGRLGVMRRRFRERLAELGIEGDTEPTHEKPQEAKSR
jgi:DNA-directed RNA polymerase specialized sigma24 family protein